MVYRVVAAGFRGCSGHVVAEAPTFQAAVDRGTSWAQNLLDDNVFDDFFVCIVDQWGEVKKVLTFF